ncbi:MAG: hypothetical protein EA362_01010 [Saprospirales bacterium]|nr:MAG: hypothetical protein EA362_01010 [Saprospirales bacterium]
MIVFIPSMATNFNFIKLKCLLFLLSLFLFSTPVLSQTFTDGYFNFPAPECFKELEPGDFGMRLLYKADYNVPTYATALVADINNDGNPNIISISGDGFTMGNSSIAPFRVRNVVIFNGKTGDVMRIIETPFMHFYGPSPIAIADINNDGNGEIIISTLDHTSNSPEDRGRLICYDYMGKELWRTSHQIGMNSPKRFGSSPGIADFNGDGIPEVYIFNEIYNAQTGALLAEGGNNGIGLMDDNRELAALATSVAADLTNSPGLELVAGRTVYEVEINNPNGTAGNSMTPINANFMVGSAPARDGFTAVADINLNGKLDVIVATARQGNPLKRTVYVWDPRESELVAYAVLTDELPSENKTGVPFVGDIDGNGNPNIGVCTPLKVEMFYFDGTTELKPNWKINTNDRSGQTLITMFDFNQNGKKEIVYRDETRLRIFDGSVNPPLILAEEPSFSLTATEGPVVADITGDGRAEIIVASNNNNSNSTPSIGRYQVFSSSLEPWGPARSVWNQYQYFNVHINDDLTVSSPQPNHGLVYFEDDEHCPTTFERRPLNNFMVQSTLYDENGCRSTPLSDSYIRIESIEQDCTDPDEMVVYFTIGNQSADAPVPAQTPVSFYNGNPKNILAEYLVTFFIPNAIPPEEERGPFSVILNNADQIDWLYGLVNDDGSQSPPVNFPITNISECDYSNNIDSVEIMDGIGEIETSELIYTCDIDEAGVVENTYVTAAGCDSTHIINTVWQPSYEIYEESWVCNPQDTGFVVYEGLSQFGCDSIHTTQFNLAPTHNLMDEHGSCSPSDTGVVVHVYTNQFGCDSIVTTLTVLLPSNEFFVEQFSCIPADTGMVVENHTNSFGCDSVYFIQTVLLESDETFEFYDSCNPIDTGTVVEIYSNELGCDSIHYIITELLPTDTTIEVYSSVNPLDTGQVVEYYRNQFGCDSLFIVLTELDVRIYIPNAFSPNGDGINDEFRVYSNGLSGITLQIFNRWGTLVFESHDENQGWDGTFKGEILDPGIFVFQLTAFYLNGTSEKHSGDLLLVR